jgi:tRNA wybutosine-synthesizing protein 4
MEEAFKLNQKNKKNRNDIAVQGTNDSAVLSKISMAQLGYFNDDYLKYFGVKAVRRSPIINRYFRILVRIYIYFRLYFKFHKVLLQLI